MGHKAVKTTHNISSTLAQELLTNPVQWWFKKSYKGNKSLENKEHGGWPSEVDNSQLRGSSKLILLQFTIAAKQFNLTNWKCEKT